MNNGSRKSSFRTAILLIVVLFVTASAIYFASEKWITDPILKRWIHYSMLSILMLCAVAVVLYYSAENIASNSRMIIRQTLSNETRPILSYLGRVLTKEEAGQPRAEATFNNLLHTASQNANVKMSLDTTNNAIIPFETIVFDERRDPVIIIRPFIFANFGKSIAVGITLSLNDKKISTSSDFVVEPNQKVQLEVNDTIKFSRDMKFFTMSYCDIYGNEYEVRLDGLVEYAKDESQGLERDVYFYYVEGFSENFQ